MHVRSRILARSMVVVVGLSGAALAFGTAHADVARYQTQSALLTVSLGSEFPGNVHLYDIIINPCDRSFTGVNDAASNTLTSGGETITGTLDGGNVSFTATYANPVLTANPYIWTGSGPLAGFTGGDNLQPPEVFNTLSGTVTNQVNVTSYKNHGAFVSSSADKNDAAHSCIGMPVNSK